MIDFQPFIQERVMSYFEQDIDYNLAESGVHPLLLRALSPKVRPWIIQRSRDYIKQGYPVLQEWMNHVHMDNYRRGRTFIKVFTCCSQ